MLTHPRHSDAHGHTTSCTTTYRCVCVRVVTTFLAGWTQTDLLAKLMQVQGVTITYGITITLLTESARTRRVEHLVRTCAVRNALSVSRLV